MGLFDGDFDMISFDSTTRIESKQLLSKNKRKSMLIQREQCISDLLPNISDGEQLYIVSNENFGSIELLSALTSKMKCQEIYITIKALGRAKRHIGLSWRIWDINIKSNLKLSYMI